jgi:hypothetical protein
VPATTIDFPPFQLDLRAGQLRRDGTPIPLRPKTSQFSGSWRSVPASC